MESQPKDMLHLEPILQAAGAESSDTAYWDFLLMLAYGDSNKAQQLYKSLRQEVRPDDWRMPLVEIGEARALSISSKELDAHKRLQSAEKIIFSRSHFLSEEIQSEILALYYYVLTIHQKKMNPNISALVHLDMGRRLTTIDSFQLAFDYAISANEAGLLHFPIENMLGPIKKLEQSGLWTLACIGYRTAAIYSRGRNDSKSCRKFFDAAFSIASERKLALNIKQIHMALGYTFFKENRLDEAEQEFLKIVPTEELDPILPILHENFALIAQARSRIDESISHIYKAIKVSTQLDTVSTITGEHLSLGEVYENHFNDLDQAEHHYKLGYDHAMRYASEGISLAGDRRDVVVAYTNLLKKMRHSTSVPKPTRPDDHFAFSQGKPWKEIKDIFHHQLVCYHHPAQPNSKALAKQLEMPASTLYSLQKRLKGRGYELPDKTSPGNCDSHNLFSFIEEHEDLSWEAINEIFEREIIHYLYEKYGYNKLRMAQVLKLSYPSIITKTRELTDVHDHLLQN